MGWKKWPIIGNRSSLMNDHQKKRFSNKIVQTLYNTVADKKIARFLGLGFQKRHQRHPGIGSDIRSHRLTIDEQAKNRGR